ncbi:RxLR-like protein [Plasmopara halstedii]|uniref:RxLR-like protein n=1 Tax=Plasmopara halstedii TaxID=4781 RepID=A0A0P1AF02_PLAHL|nr:RxLR-like protein [Plasmopara halstedii]CEG39274.1 RxLR-like protein [Plasmopara halstedii]|eukprot:XP_024575643.1 RxLR-like protein [Plasmopara halstedii]
MFARFLMLLSGCALLASVSANASLMDAVMTKKSQVSDLEHVAETVQARRNLRGLISLDANEANTHEERILATIIKPDFNPSGLVWKLKRNEPALQPGSLHFLSNRLPRSKTSQESLIEKTGIASYANKKH